MFAFPNWLEFAVTQKDPETGCIPAIYEMMLKAAGATNINYDTFQTEFNLQKRGIAGNHFVSIAEAIQQKYPSAKFAHEPFVTGKEKLARIEKLLERGKLVAVSITLEPFVEQKGWHIMPIIEWDAAHVITLAYLPPPGAGEAQKWRLTKKQIVEFHDKYEGGNDIAYLESWNSESLQHSQHEEG